jgi:hypothetical protein
MADVNVQLSLVEVADNQDGVISPGESFQVDVSFVPDADNTAVVAGAVDLLFDADNFTVDEITYGQDFDYVYDDTAPEELQFDPPRNSGQTPVEGEDVDDGVLEEVGATYELLPEPNSEPPNIPIPAPQVDLLFSVRLTAKESFDGSETTISTESAEDDISITLTQGTEPGTDQIAVLSQTPPEQVTDIEYGSLDLSLLGDDGTPEPPQSDTIELFRFRNTSFDSGTYLFVGAEERDGILDNPDFNETFELEGDGNAAFVASTGEGDDLIPFYRLASLDVPGTYLFVSDGEYDAIFAEDSDQRDKWEKEGLDGEGEDIAEFYLYDGSANLGVEFNRFQNTENGTFLYAGPDETEAIESDPNLSNLFVNQGVAFESL